MRINPITNFNFQKRNKNASVTKKNEASSNPPEREYERMISLLQTHPAMFCAYMGDRVIVLDPQRGFVLSSRPVEEFNEDTYYEED